MISAFYHIYLTDNSAVWSNIVFEQFKLIEDSKLINHIDFFYITAISKNTNMSDQFLKLVKTYNFKNLEVEFVQNTSLSDSYTFSNLNYDNNIITENYSLKKIWNYSKNFNSNILYFHSKAITSYDIWFKLNPEKHKQNVYWRQYLNWGVLEKWMDCVNALNYNDVAGVNYKTNPIQHYSGNFWWSKSSYIKTLPDPSATNWWYEIQQNTTDQWFKTCSLRFRDEHWISHKSTTKFFVVN